MSARARVLGVVAIGTLLSSLGQSLVNVALPRIASELDTDPRSASWILSAYALAVSALLLPAGRAADRIGRAPIYVLGFVIVAIGATLCALSTSLGALVAARVVQGGGAALLMATGPALTTAAFPTSERGRALGAQATATYVGLTIGPALGGAIAAHAGWQAIFAVSIPIAAIGGMLARLTLERAPTTSTEPFPISSALLVAPALAASIGALGGQASWLVGAAAVSWILFAIAEHRSAAPLLPPAMLRDPTLVTGAVAALAQYAAVYVLLFALPFHLRDRLALPPDEAGLVMCGQPAAMALTTAASGWLSDRIGPRVPTVVGMLVLALGSFCLHLAASDERAIVFALALTGLGSGLFTSPNASRVMGAAAPERRGLAAGLLAQARNVGVAIGIALSSLAYATHGLDATVAAAIGLAVVGAVITAR